MQNNKIISCSNISKSYKIIGNEKTQVLKNISFDVEVGEFIALVGPSGVGKSTLLHIIGTLDEFDGGNVIFSNDQQIFNYSELSAAQLTRIRNRHIGFVFQFHHLLPEFTALENVMMPALIANEKNKTAEQKALNLISEVGLENRKHHKPGEISGGEQQRIAIARALINNPSLLLADEPTGNLDSENANIVLELIDRLRKQFNTTLIIATHSIEVAKAADRIIYLADGKINREERNENR